MINDHLDPLSTCPTGHIIPDPDYANCICRFYKGITEWEVLKSLESMKFYLDLFVAPGRIKRSMVIAALKLSGNHKKIGLMMKYKPIPACADSCQKLQDLYNKAVLPTAYLANEYYNNLSNIQPLNHRFARTFG